jgi:hypothetical protein
VLDSAGDAAGFFLKRPGRIAFEFSKVALLGISLQMVFVLIVAAMGTAVGNAGGAEALAIGGMALIVVLGVAFFIVTTAISATPYCIVDGMLADKRTGIISKARELLRPVAGYCGVILGAFLVVLGIALATNMVIGGLAGGFIMLLVLVAVVATVFLFQFALPEIAVAKKGALDALKSSFILVSKNLWTAIFFDILMLVPVLGTIVALMLPQEIISGMIPDAGDLALTFALFLASLALSLLETLLVSLISVSLTYFFWRRLSSA